jgi:hypothetical protein
MVVAGLFVGYMLVHVDGVCSVGAPGGSAALVKGHAAWCGSNSRTTDELIACHLAVAAAALNNHLDRTVADIACSRAGRGVTMRVFGLKVLFQSCGLCSLACGSNLCLQQQRRAFVACHEACCLH